MCWGALQTLDHLILREVKRHQLRISSIKALVREVDVLLLRLDATEGDDLRHLASSRHEGVSAVAEVVIEHAAQERAPSTLITHQLITHLLTHLLKLPVSEVGGETFSKKLTLGS